MSVHVSEILQTLTNRQWRFRDETDVYYRQSPRWQLDVDCQSIDIHIDKKARIDERRMIL